MIRSLGVAITVVLCIGLSEGWTENLEFDDCWGINYAYEDKDYLVKWTGQDRGTGCKVTFNGYDSSNALDKYKVCLRATEWDVDTSVTLKYYAAEGVLDYDLQKTFTKYGDSPENEWCSESDDYVNIQLSTTSSSSGSIELKVWAEKTKDYGQMIGIIVGSVIGGLVLLGIVVTIVIIIACNKRKGMSGTVLTNQNRGGQIISTTNTQAGIQPMAGFQSNAYSQPPPAYNQTTGYTYSGPQQYPQGQMVPQQYPQGQMIPQQK